MRVHQFIGLSIDKRDRQAKEEKARQQREIKLRKTAQRRAYFFGLVLVIALILTGVATRQLHRATINEINTLSNSAEALSASSQELDALVAGLKAAKKIQNSIFGVDNKIGFKVIEILQNIFYRIKEFNRLEDHHDEVRGVEFSPDGQIIASASYDGTIKLWSLNLDKVLARGCDWVRDYLTNNPNVSEEDRKICKGI